ncbi:hypothetical protein [Undibacterium sp.]|uniref:hypothetical protein n=1 Tax=Undibacterium sp. TaxID=1914977 RepID=UPI002C107724|nr:hypothetical protein [Undibacterium sp.]HTD02502.1 hypothetical protein [Undibacterium sp.]
MGNTSNPAEMLPVGMLGNVDAGSPAAQALEAIAIRKHGTPGWGPFHYEKMSATEYEVTGGVALVLTGGLRKWPEPHTSVSVSVEEIIAELTLLPAVAEAAPAAEPSAAPTAPPASVQGISNPAASRYLTVVLQLPEDKEGRLRLIDAFSPDQHFFGARVAATSMEHEIAVSQALAQYCTPEDVALARQNAR